MAEPTIVERQDQPYVALRGKVAMTEISAFADRMHEVIGWLAARNIEPVDAPFFKYDVVDMDEGLVMEIGFPVEERHHGEEQIVTGVLPAGRYASLTHHGHPDGLEGATRDLLAWADKENLEWDANGNTWTARLEVYKSDPREVPDMNNWETELLFRLRD